MMNERLENKIAAATAHRACCGTEQDVTQGKLHGYCVVCGVEWPCKTARTFLFNRDEVEISGEPLPIVFDLGIFSGKPGDADTITCSDWKGDIKTLKVGDETEWTFQAAKEKVGPEKPKTETGAGVLTMAHCPFCDGRAFISEANGESWRIGCADESCHGYLDESGSLSYSSLYTAISAWNKRAK